MGAHGFAAPAAGVGAPPRSVLVLAAGLLLILLLAARGVQLGSLSTDTTQLRHSVSAMQQQLSAIQQALAHINASAHGHATVLAATKQELGTAKAELAKQLTNSAARWVKDKDLAHRGTAGAACSANRSSGTAGLRLDVAPGSGLVAPLVVVAYNRAHYLARCMMSVLKHWSDDPNNRGAFPLFVSIDGDHQPTLLLAASLSFAGVQVINNERSTRCHSMDGYCNLGTHYAMLLQLFFECLHAPRLIFLEEDLEIAPDFFSYFTGLAPLLDADPSLLCASAWNDHGQAGRASNASALLRTDVMPGLGWMLNARLAAELLPHWQAAGWDEYTRNPCVRKGRQCVFPEVPRTHTFGAVGNSGGLFYKEHLSNMLLNTQRIDWTAMDLSHMRNASYAASMERWLAAALPLPAAAFHASDGSQLRALCAVPPPDQQAAGPAPLPPGLDADVAAAVTGNPGRDLLVTFRDHGEYGRLAAQLAPMLGDISVGGGVPRASYHGTVMVRCRGRRLFLTPAANNTLPTPKCGG